MASVVAGDMPSGATWRGVYYSQLYGYLHIEADGDKLQIGVELEGFRMLEPALVVLE